MLALLSAVGAWAQGSFEPSNAPTGGVWDPNTHWYFISFPNSDEFHSGGYLAAEGNGYIDATNYSNGVSNGKILITKTEKPIKYSALWCMVGDAENGYTFYNRMNPYLKLGIKDNVAKLYKSDGTYENVQFSFKYQASTSQGWSGYATFYYGTNSRFNNQDAGGNRSDYLTVWSSDNALSDNGSALKIEAVTGDELQQMQPSVPVSNQEMKNYFFIQSERSGKYANYTGDASQISQTNRLLASSVWYVTDNDGGYYLHNYNTNKKYNTTSSFTDAGTKVYIKENPYCAGYMCISTDENLASNCWDDQGNETNVGIWHPEVTDFEGTSWSLVPITAEAAKEVLTNTISDLQTYFDSNNTVGQYTLSVADRQDFNSAVSVAQNVCNNQSASIDECLNQINTLNGYREKAVLITPEKGKFYRLKNVVSGRYMADVDGSPKMKDPLDTENRAITIFYLGENNELLSYSLGQYLNCLDKNFAAVDTKYAGEFGVAYGGVTPNVVTYKNNGGWTFGNKNDGESIDKGNGVNANGYNWTFEKVTWLPVPMNQTAGYATIFSPVALELSEGRVKAYTAEVNDEKNKVKLISKEKVLPNTGMILEYVSGIQEGCVYLQVTDGVAPGTSHMTGSFEKKSIDEAAYVLSMQNSKVGLYKAQVTNGAWINNAFRAYLPASAVSAGARFLTFDFDDNAETGINAVEIEEAAPANAAIYDLSGRRVQSAKSGLYIINGKKVIK